MAFNKEVTFLAREGRVVAPGRDLFRYNYHDGSVRESGTDPVTDWNLLLVGDYRWQYTNFPSQGELSQS